MLTLNNVRKEIGPDCRKVLTYIWAQFLEGKQWPSSRSVHSKLGKEFVGTFLRKTNGSVVSEMTDAGILRYQLFGCGPLLTEHTAQYRQLLLRYLNLLRTLYRDNPEKRSVTNLEVEKALKLTTEQSTLLFHLIFVGNLTSHGSGFGEAGWTAGVLTESEDFPEGDLSATLEEHVLRSYTPGCPVFQADQVEAALRSAQPRVNTARKPRKASKVGASDRTRKILWAKSGNRCAICRQKLVVDQTLVDSVSVVGEECHIIAQSEGGPRHDKAFLFDKIDSLENLILLCATHHKMVDDQVQLHTADWIRQKKAEHEKWVDTQLGEMFDPASVKNSSKEKRVSGKTRQDFIRKGVVEDS